MVLVSSAFKDCTMRQQTPGVVVNCNISEVILCCLSDIPMRAGQLKPVMCTSAPETWLVGKLVRSGFPNPRINLLIHCLWLLGLGR